MFARHYSNAQRSLGQQVVRQAVTPDMASRSVGRPHPMLHLQRTLGNREVARLLHAQRLPAEEGLRGLQPKLMVGAARDQYEQEADRVARQVLSTPHAAVARALPPVAVPEEEQEEKLQTAPVVGTITRVVQRQMAAEDDEELLQAKRAEPAAGRFVAGDELETQLSLSKGRGSPLPDSVRAFMEPRFGVDFSQVQVHTDREAMQMNEAVGAQAFTHGQDIYFGAGQSPTDLALTAHELTHVVQQTGGRSLQTKRPPGLASAGAEPAVQRVCGACAARSTPCASCATEETPIQRQVAPSPSDRDRAVEQVTMQRRTKSAAVSRARGPQITRALEAVQRYSWDEFVNDVEDVGSAAVEGVQQAGEAVVSGAEAVGEAVASGAEAVGEAVTAGAEAVGEAAGAVGEAVSGAVDWVLTEAGQLALEGANALAGLVGGSVTVGPSGLIISIPNIELFESHREEIIPPTPRVYVPLLAAGAALGPVVLVGSVGIPVGAPTMTVFLGPGRVQNILIRIDPAASTYSASGELYVGAALNAYMQTGAAVRVDALTAIPTEPPIPVQAALEGGLLLTLQGSEVGSIARAVTLAYTAGAISLDLTDTLRLGVIAEMDLDAYLNAQLYEIEICEFIWPLEHWEASRAEEYSLPLSLRFSGGAATITIGPVSAAPIPVEDIETGLERFRPETHCKELEEVIAELCERGILPPEVCDALDQEEPGILKDVTASGRCKCVGDDACGGGKIYEVCYRTQKNCKNSQKDLDNFCNNNSEMKEKCTRPKCYYRHSDPNCPDDCDPGTIKPLEELPEALTCPTQTVTMGGAKCGTKYGAVGEYCYSGAKNWWFKEKVVNGSPNTCDTSPIDQTTTPIQSTSGCVDDQIFNFNGPPAARAPCKDVTNQTVFTGPTKADVEKCKYNNKQVIEVTVNKGSTPKSGKVITSSAGESTDCDWS